MSHRLGRTSGLRSSALTSLAVGATANVTRPSKIRTKTADHDVAGRLGKLGARAAPEELFRPFPKIDHYPGGQSVAVSTRLSRASFQT